MKNQYFGDVNDYRKYGILRCLRDAGHSLGVHWMLTPDDLGRDGRKLAYLDSPASWQPHDPALYAFLRDAVGSGARHVRTVQDSDLLGGARYFDEHVPERGLGRLGQLHKAMQRLAESTLIFFDPDNGIEVPSTPLRAAGSSKYVYWSELRTAWSGGHSLLVYQHYPRVPRARFEAELVAAFRDRLEAEPLLLRTSNVLFILVHQADHAAWTATAVRDIGRRWGGQVDVAG